MTSLCVTGHQHPTNMSNKDYEISSGGDFTPHAVLSESVSYLDTELKIQQFQNPLEEPVGVGDALMIDGEVMYLQALSGDIMTVKRGCSDTVPIRHVANAAVWFFRSTNSNMREYVGGDVIGVKVLPFIPSSTRLPIEAADPKELTFNYRFIRPYPPGQMRGNGMRWYTHMLLTGDEPTLNLTWVDRNRVVQSDVLVGHDEGGVAPEPGTHYRFRVYNHNNQLVRTETGILGNSVNYHWAQAINDFGVPLVLPPGHDFAGRMFFETMRDGYNSWTGYDIRLIVNNASPQMFVSLAGEQSASRSNETPMQPSLAVATGAMQVAQTDSLADQHTIALTAFAEHAAQPTSFYTALTRTMFEAPYTFLLRKNIEMGLNRVRLTTVAARPSDRMTDNHRVYGRNHPTNPWVEHDYLPFTPWVTIDEDLPYLATRAAIAKTSLHDGVPLDGVKVGQMAAMGGEIVRVVALDSNYITLARGCVDTVPSFRKIGTRIWFFEAECGITPKASGWGLADNVQTKIVPVVYGPQIDLNLVPTDSVDMAHRVDRPFPPGEMRVDGNPWFERVQAAPGKSNVFTWVQRNRLSQTTEVLSHHAPNVTHEPGTMYRLKLALSVRGADGKPAELVIREVFVPGNSFTYTFDMAVADGMRAASILDACGYVVVPMYIDAVRDGLTNWQGYSVPMILPAPQCPINKPPGGGQGPKPNNPGNKPPGGGQGPNPPTPGQNPDKPDPEEPDAPTIPPTWPPVPPEPIDPQDPGEPDPDDTEPDPGDTGQHWDYTWDIHWDAYRRHGDNNEGEG